MSVDFKSEAQYNELVALCPYTGLVKCGALLYGGWARAQPFHWINVCRFIFPLKGQ